MYAAQKQCVNISISLALNSYYLSYDNFIMHIASIGCNQDNKVAQRIINTVCSSCTNCGCWDVDAIMYFDVLVNTPSSNNHGHSLAPGHTDHMVE